MTSTTNTEAEFISVPEWCSRVGCSLDTGYRAARRDKIPGLFRIGRLMRVNWPAFVLATTPPGSDGNQE
jgi:predicted DNA-binding transcriptional regulator AlpA